MSSRTPHPNFRQKLHENIERGRSLYSAAHSNDSSSLKPKDQEFFNIFERDINDYKTFQNKVNTHKITEKGLSHLQKKFMEDGWKIKIAEEILAEKEVFEKNENLKKNIEKLKRLNLLCCKELKIKNFKSTGKSQYIMNDYHTRSTNPGFSRNKLGNFFTN